MTPEALIHLRSVDQLLSEVIDEVGELDFKPWARRSPFESLVRAVAHQQLHGKAAETILGRFVGLFGTGKFPSAEELTSIEDEQLRSVGFSRAKVAAIRDIAAKSLDGIIPTSRQITKLSDQEIIERLVAVRGVGRWTVEMLLIFQLGRPDVLPSDDFGIRNGFRVVYGLPEMPAKKYVLEHGKTWAPHRSTAALYLWRAADRAKSKSPANANREEKDIPPRAKRATKST